jgi:protein-S-isoprenylcysteine O-methyltransferase Ste14
MTHEAFWDWTGYLWITVGLLWLLTSLRSKATIRKQSIGSWLLHTLIMVSAFYLVFTHMLNLGPLDARIISSSPAADAAGLAGTAVGIAFAVWARFFLGGNWSAAVTMKQDHELVRNGPYRIVRHPIYSGFLLGLLGTALIHGRGRDFVGFGLAFLGWWLKSRTEEKFMVELFDGEYIEYRRQVKRLVPYVI